jgi:hypothetical protein
VDLLVLGVEDLESLHAIEPLVKFVKPDGAFWVVYPKNRKEVPEHQVLHAGRDAGLKDVKMMRFAASHSAVKFVIRWESPPAGDEPTDDEL